MTRAEFLYAVRADLGLSQRAFAKLLGVSNAAISRWESGHRAISPMALRTVEQVTGRAYGEG